MSDTICSGIVKKITDGKFDGQYEIEIELADGSILKGSKDGAYNGLQVYEKKKDGNESKVWPLIQDSKFKGNAYVWMGNVKESDTQAGVKTYATVTWGELDPNFGPMEPNTWGQQGPTQEAAPVAEPEGWDGPPPAAAPQPAPVAQPATRPVAQTTPRRTQSDSKDALITATAITKSLIEGQYLTPADLESGAFKDLVTKLVALVHEVAGS